MKFSIIIPMYNVELYIKRCLMSCLHQDIPSSEYEIVVVNDGSPDKSLLIAERIASTVSNIRIVSQPNGGLSVARNTGLKNAKGRYVWFVDSDDCIRENCIGRLIEQCDDENLDLLAVGAADVIDNEEKRRFTYSVLSVVSGSYLLDRGEMQHCVPFTIYRREFLLKHRLNFYPGIFHEDSEFSPRAYFFAQRVSFTNEILYLVTINPTSITRTINYKKSFDCLKVARSIHDFFCLKAKNANACFFHNHISLMINNGMSNFMERVEFSTIREQSLKMFCEELYDSRYLFEHLCKSTIVKYKIEGYLFSLFPHYSMFIYRFLQRLRSR